MIIDMHVHTSQLSCSKLSPEDAILGAKQKGLDGICFMEHGVLWDRDKTSNLRDQFDFWVISGLEVTTNYGHILVYGLNHWDKNGYVYRCFAPYFPLKELKKIVERSGAYRVATHPFREPGYLQEGYGSCRLTVDPEDVLNRPVFHMVEALEGFNGQSSPEENMLSFLVAQALGLPAVGASDAHSRKEVGDGATVFSRNFSQEADFLWMLKTGYFRLRE